MTIEMSELNMIRKSQDQARILLQAYGDLSQVNVLWAGAPAYQNSISQNDLDGQFPGTNLTTQQLADAEYALAVIKGNIENSLVALTILANLP